MSLLNTVIGNDKFIISYDTDNTISDIYSAEDCNIKIIKEKCKTFDLYNDILNASINYKSKSINLKDAIETIISVLPDIMELDEESIVEDIDDVISFINIVSRKRMNAIDKTITAIVNASSIKVKEEVPEEYISAPDNEPAEQFIYEIRTPDVPVEEVKEEPAPTPVTHKKTKKKEAANPAATVETTENN